MIRLIASDLDGTLVPEGGSVLTPEYYDVIRELKKKGIIFIAASGRGLPSARKLLQPVSEDVYFLTEEGAYGSWRDKILFETTLDEKVAEREAIRNYRNGCCNDRWFQTEDRIDCNMDKNERVYISLVIKQKTINPFYKISRNFQKCFSFSVFLCYIEQVR